MPEWNGSNQRQDQRLERVDLTTASDMCGDKRHDSLRGGGHHGVLWFLDTCAINIDTTFFFCSQLKNTIIDQMSTVEVTSIEQVTQMAAVVALATEQKDEISQNSQV